jgi:hypothetical protein
VHVLKRAPGSVAAGGRWVGISSAPVIATPSIRRYWEFWKWIGARWRKKASRQTVHPVWDTLKAVAANLDARAARTGPGQSVSRSLLLATA